MDPDYAKTFDLKIVQGRDFSKNIPTDSSQAFIVNESALPLLGYEDPIGKKLTLADREGRIIKDILKPFRLPHGV